MTPNVKLDTDAAAEVMALASTINRASVFNVWMTLAVKVDGEGVAQATAEEIAEQIDVSISEVHDCLDLLVDEGLLKTSKKTSSYFVFGAKAA